MIFVDISFHTFKGEVNELHYYSSRSVHDKREIIHRGGCLDRNRLVLLRFLLKYCRLQAKSWQVDSPRSTLSNGGKISDFR